MKCKKHNIELEPQYNEFAKGLVIDGYICPKCLEIENNKTELLNKIKHFEKGLKICKQTIKECKEKLKELD